MSKEVKAEVALVREKNAREKAEWERKRDMPQYMAVVIINIHTKSIIGNWRLHDRAFYHYVAQAAMAAGDLLWIATKQSPVFPGRFDHANSNPDFLQFEALVHFVSDHLDWEQASAWLRDALDGYRDENVTVLSVERFKGSFGT